MPRHVFIALAILFLATAAKASAAKHEHADQVVELIHAQSIARLKSDNIVPVQRLAGDGLPLPHARYRHAPHMPHLIGINPKHASSGSAASASTIQNPSVPVMVVPMPETSISAHRDGGNKATVIVVVDENSRTRKMDIPATTRPSQIGDKQLVGMEDDGLVRTMDIPMTASARSTPAAAAAAATAPPV